MPKKALIVDDSRYIRTLIHDALVQHGYDVIEHATNGQDAIDIATRLQPDLITLDNILPDMSGIDVLISYRLKRLPSKIIIISVEVQESIIRNGLKLGALKYISKPFTKEQLSEAFSSI